MLQQLANGLTVGVVYALIAMGFSLVWATARTMNFAYGAIYTLGAYTLFVVYDTLGETELGILPLFLAFAIAAAVGAGAGYGLERAIFRPLRSSELAPLLATLGVGIFAENLLTVQFGAGVTTLEVSGAREFFDIGSVRLSITQIIVLTLSVGMMVALHYLVSRTSLGRAMRSTAWNRDAAQLVGINVNRVIAMVFIISSVMAVWAGLFVGLYYGTITPYMGFDVVIKGLAAAVLGGFGYIPGAIVGGLLIGVVEAFGAELTTAGNWPDVIAYTVLIAVILLRPQGLFGHRVPQAS